MDAFDRSDFRKSSYSDPDKNCVEVAHDGEVVEIRDSKCTFGSAADGRLRVGGAGFAAFLNAVRGGGHA